MFCSSLSPENCWKDSPLGVKFFVQANNDQTDFKTQKNTQLKCELREGINLGYFEQHRMGELLKIAGCVFFCHVIPQNHGSCCETLMLWILKGLCVFSRFKNTKVF